MIDIKDIRTRYSEIRKNIQDRYMDVDLDRIVSDMDRRSELLQRTEALRARRNETEKRDMPIEHVSDDRSHEHDETEKRDTPIDYYSISAPKDEEKEDEPKDGPYVITPREYGSIDEYEQIILVFWKDHVLTDDNFDIVEDIEDCVGFESLNHFGEYMDDVVYVRNDRTKCDYEISLDLRTYDEVVRERPYIRGVL